TVVLASGGMSHFPGTNRYSNPELAWDRRVLEKLAAGNLKSLIGFDENELDDTGNIELRCWACAGRRARRAQARRRVDGSELASQLRLAGLDRYATGGARDALSLDKARTGRADLGAARACARSGQARALHRRCAGLCGRV